MHIFITGIAGFIGFHTARFLAKKGYVVSGCDTYNEYYPPALKFERARILKELGIPIYSWNCTNLPQYIDQLSKSTHIIHFAAQAGVRHSLSHPESYIENNILGTFGVLEACKKLPNVRLIFASSSSVYGLNKKFPFSEDDSAESPANLYAATKRSTEHMAFSYHSLYNIPMCGLRLFTVYGSYGRPDMAYFSFAKKIMQEEELPLFNEGKMERDFTHISDIVQGIEHTLTLTSPWEIINLGNSNPASLLSLIRLLEEGLKKKARIQLLPMQPGEVIKTYADISKAKKLLQYQPTVSLDQGIAEFIDWFRKDIQRISLTLKAT